MSIELQIQSPILGNIAARAVAARLSATCFPPLGASYVDHADLAAAPVQVVAAHSTVRVRVPVDVFIVSRKDVLAAPNSIPPGATVPAQTVVLVLELAAMGTVVSLQPVDVEGAGAARPAIIQAFGAPVNLDLSSTFKKLSIPPPAAARVEIVGNIVAIRFDPNGGAASHLFPGEDWGFFLDSGSVEQLAKSKVPADLTSHITSLAVDAHWRPSGSTPHVDVDYAGKAPQVPDPFSGDVNGTLACDFSLTPTVTKSLRTTVQWSLHINLGDLVPGFIEDIVADKVAGFFDPSKFGGTPIGDHAFSMDTPLPDISFGGARFGYASTLASTAGMTIGGSVRLSDDLGKATVQPSVYNFGLPFHISMCRTLAKSGSGAPSKTVSLGEVSTNASVWLENMGALCEVEILSPGAWLTSYLTAPPGTPEIRISIPSAVALGITQPVRLLVRTARGVRLIDLGTPPPVKVDASGNVTNATTIYIDNCLYLRGDHSLTYSGLLNPSEVNPPIENPDWASYLAGQPVLDVQLVTLSALEPGELIQFRSRDHAIDVTADRNGQAIVPVLLPLADDRQAANLSRVNRQSIAGRFAVTTATFVSQASLPAGNQHHLTTTADGTALLTTTFKTYTEVHEIGSLGAPTLLRREHACNGHANELAGFQSGAAHQEVALNPQPLPPHEVFILTRDQWRVRKIDLPGLVSLVPVPGFAEAPIALANMLDGSVLVLDLAEQGSARVSGVFRGPIGHIDVAGSWAVAANAGRASLYRVIRG